MSNAVHVGEVSKLKNGAKFFKVMFEDAIFFWSSLHEASQKHGAADGINEFSIKALITESQANKIEELELNKEPKEVPLTFKDGPKGEKLKKKFGKYVPYAEKSDEPLYLINLSRAEFSKGRDVPNKVEVYGKNPKLGYLTEKIGHGSVGSFRLGCIEGEAGGPSEGTYNTYLDALQILNLEEWVDTDQSEESQGAVGFGNYGDDERHSCRYTNHQ